MGWDVAPQCDCITQGFGCTDYSEWYVGYDTCQATGQYHDGIDISAYGGSCGLPLYATRAGVVYSVGYVPGGMQNGLGDHAVVIQADEGVYLLYGHCDSATVAVGQRVKPGDQVAVIGTRGYSDGCHCHFAAKQLGALADNPPAGCLDPTPYMTSTAAPEEEDMTPDQANQLQAIDDMTRKLFNMLANGIGTSGVPAEQALHIYGGPGPWGYGFGSLGTIDTLARTNYNEIIGLGNRLTAIEDKLGISTEAQPAPADPATLGINPPEQ